MNNTTDIALTNLQKEILNGIKARIMDQFESFKKIVDPREPDKFHERQVLENSVIAIMGSRGWGKTLIMEQLKNDLKAGLTRPGNSQPLSDFLVTDFVDGSLVRRDEGIISTCLQRLNALSKSQTKQHHQDKYSNLKKLTDEFKANFKSALSLVDSYRTLAREMAMSPSHYEEMVEKGINDRQDIANNFNSFLDTLELETTGAAKKHLFVIFIDDLDMAPEEELITWARSLNHHYRNIRVVWILSFYYDRLVGCLSSTSSSSVDKEKDLVTGKALLSKLVNYNQRFNLNVWNIKERIDFRPLDRSSDKLSLSGLLQKNGYQKMLLLAPNNPRSLSGLYYYLENNPSKTSESRNATDPAKNEENLEQQTRILLERLVELNGYKLGFDLLKRNTPTQLAAKFTWNPDVDLHPSEWNMLIKSISNYSSLIGLPLPKELSDNSDNITESISDAFTETILNASMLIESTITPLLILQKLNITQKRILKCKTEIEFGIPTLKNILEYPSEGMLWSSYWGHWEKMQQPNNKPNWKFVLSPSHFWETISGFKNVKPDTFFTSLYSADYALDSRFSKILKEHAELKNDLKNSMPRDLRALLLMVNALQMAPWSALENRKTMWPFFTYAQFASAIYLSSLAYYLWLDNDIIKSILETQNQCGNQDNNTPEKPTLYCYDSFYSLLFNKEAAVINENYCCFISALTNLTEDENCPDSNALFPVKANPSSTNLGKSPMYEDARKELYRVLRLTVRLPMVTKLLLNDCKLNCT